MTLKPWWSIARSISLDHVSHVRGVRARDERSPGRDQFFHRVDRLIDRAGTDRSCDLNPIGEVGEVCFFVSP